MNYFRPTRIGAICGFVGAVILAVMFAVGLSGGDALARIDQPNTPEAYAAAIRPGADIIIRVIALDNLFVIAYTGTFLGAAALTWRWTRFLPAIGLGAALLLALLDFTENAATVNVARAVLASVPVPAWEITFLSLIGQVKYASATIAVAFFAIALVSDRRPFTVAVIALYLLFPVVNAASVIVPAAALLLVGWMLVLLVVSGVFLWKRAGEAD